VYGRCFSADGSPQGDEFLVNTTIAYSQAHPAISMNRGRDFVVAWESWKEDSPGVWSYDVYARAFAPGGVADGDEVRVNTYTAGDQWQADLALNENGEFVVSWTSWNQDGDGGGVYARRFETSGMAGEVFRLNEVTDEYQWLSRVDLADDGTLTAAWSSWRQDGSREGVYYRLFDAENVPTTPDYRANEITTDYQWEPALSTSDGRIAIAYSSFGEDGDDYGIFLRRFEASSVAAEGAELPSEGIHLSVYPNPASDHVQIRYAGSGLSPIRIELFDTLGRLLHRSTAPFPVGSHVVPLGSLLRPYTSGVIVVRVKAGAYEATEPVVVAR
jgi:hypothetical protein